MKPSVVDTVVRTKTQVSVLHLRLASCYSPILQISVLTMKVEQFNVKICDIGGPEVTSSSNYLKGMLDLNTELIGYLSAIGDNVNVRDLSDFLTICFCEYDSFFKDHREQITANPEQRRVLLPLASDIVFNEIRRILDFITNNTVNYTM